MIQIMKASPMKHTPFVKDDVIDYFRKRNIFMIDDEEECDVFVSNQLGYLIPLMRKFKTRKKYLVWTHEPRHDTHFVKKTNRFLWKPNVHFMNVYTGDVYLNNYREFNVYRFYVENSGYDFLEPLPDLNTLRLKQRRLVALMTYRAEWVNIKINLMGLNLNHVRQRIALKGHKLNAIDIYGKYWPNDISIGQSRDGNWHGSKLQILSKYWFNLALENTNVDYYCTEKIWDSIAAYCLPIYFGKGNKIYEDFPRGSFLDYADFNHPEELFDYINKMGDQELLDRINLCVKVFNNIIQNLQVSGRYLYENELMKIVDKIREITKLV